MSDDFLKDLFEITQDHQFEFKEVYGFTFVFRTTLTKFKEMITSAEIKPVGIIYEENGEYYFAPLYEVENISEIIEEYVKNI